MVILLYIRKVPNFYPKQLPPCGGCAARPSSFPAIKMSRPVGHEEGSKDGPTEATSRAGVALASDRAGPHVSAANAHPDLSALSGAGSAL